MDDKGRYRTKETENKTNNAPVKTVERKLHRRSENTTKIPTHTYTHTETQAGALSRFLQQGGFLFAATLSLNGTVIFIWIFAFVALSLGAILLCIHFNNTLFSPAQLWPLFTMHRGTGRGHFFAQRAFYSRAF